MPWYRDCLGQDLFGNQQLERILLALVLTGVLAGLLILPGCGAAVRSLGSGGSSFRNSSLFYTGRHGPLTKREQLWIQIAWKYFQNNTVNETGLVNGVDNQTRASMWDVADYLAALLSARRFKLVDEKEFDDRLSKLLDTLNTMPLADETLPNRYYDTKTRALVNASGEPSLGTWSAIDLGRLMLWLRITRQQAPEFTEYIDRVVLRWNVCQALDRRGNLRGATVGPNHVITHTDYARLGYQQYAASGFESWGFDAQGALSFDPADRIKLFGISLYHDGRDERITGIPAPIVSLPSLLSGLELNWTAAGIRRGPAAQLFHKKDYDMARTIYRVQQLRYQREKIITARTNHHSSQSPDEVIDAIFALGYPWNTVNAAGDVLPFEALVSTQAVFPMRALWKKCYSDVLLINADHLYQTDRGWYEGRYEKTGGFDRLISLRTNAMVLESFFYQVEGRMYHPESREGLFELWTSRSLPLPARLPGELWPTMKLNTRMRAEKLGLAPPESWGKSWAGRRP